MAILLVSPFVDPDAVGEPRWCYDLLKALSEREEAVIVSQTPRNRAYTVAELFPRSIVHECRPWQLDSLPRRIHALAKPNYVKFYAHAQRIIKEVEKDRGITCAHHFGPLALRYPTPLRNSKIPYVIGPLGGSLPTPAGFRQDRAGQPWYYAFRDVDGLRFRHDPWLRSGYMRAECVVGVADYVRDILSDVPLKQFEKRSEIAAKAPPSDIQAIQSERQSRQGAVRFLIVSRLIFSKGIQYSLRAAAKLPSHVPWQIDILGEGPMRGDLERLAESTGVAERVTFHGHLPRARVDDFYRQADIFLFPSIREPSGAVIFEAMSWGLPMIAALYGGPAAHVSDEYGIRVPVDTEDAFIRGLGAAMMALAASPAKRMALGKGAVLAARNRHSMAAMVDFYLELYGRVGRGGGAA